MYILLPFGTQSSAVINTVAVNASYDLCLPVKDLGLFCYNGERLHKDRTVKKKGVAILG